MVAANRATGRKPASKKQQPVGLSEEQLAFTFAVAKAQVLAKTKGQYPAPLAALDAIAKGLQSAARRGLKVETRAFRAAGRQSRSRAT